MNLLHRRLIRAVNFGKFSHAYYLEAVIENGADAMDAIRSIARVKRKIFWPDQILDLARSRQND